MNNVNNVEGGGSVPDLLRHIQRTCMLVEEAIKNNEGVLSDTGALVVRTGEFTGRSPDDRFIVLDEITRDTIWWNHINIPIEKDKYESLRAKFLEYVARATRKYGVVCRAGSHPKYNITIKVIAEYAWHAAFANNLFLPYEGNDTEWSVCVFPSFRSKGKEDGVRQHNFVIISFSRKEVLIGGTAYAGEIKKSIFSVMNFIMPYYHNVLSMHCAANTGKKGDVALFFGLSGTGKTSLSSDPDRFLIGDDEHIWTSEGIYNIEGGCYAKCINLDPDKEPVIYNALRFGAIVENTPFFPNTRHINFSDASITENTRAGYPLYFVKNAVIPPRGSHPNNIFFLSCDAYGVLPPVALLEENQIPTYFLSGYTSKVAGTEVGIKEPKATFSYCFGAPFMPLHPTVYSRLLVENVKKHGVKVWLINTGWIYGPYGKGHRIDIRYTRQILNAILNGNINMDKENFYYDPVFHFRVPKHISGIPDEIMYPWKCWDSLADYQQTKSKLAENICLNLKKIVGEGNNLVMPDPQASALVEVEGEMA